MNTFERIDLDALTTQRAWAVQGATANAWADFALNALRDAYAEMDRLQAVRKMWTTYDGTAETLPNEYTNVVVMGVNWDHEHVVQLDGFRWVHSTGDGCDTLQRGDRWMYIPEPK